MYLRAVYRKLTTPDKLQKKEKKSSPSVSTNPFLKKKENSKGRKMCYDI